MHGPHITALPPNSSRSHIRTMESGCSEYTPRIKSKRGAPPSGNRALTIITSNAAEHSQQQRGHVKTSTPDKRHRVPDVSTARSQCPASWPTMTRMAMDSQAVVPLQRIPLGPARRAPKHLCAELNCLRTYGSDHSRESRAHICSEVRRSLP